MSKKRTDKLKKDVFKILDDEHGKNASNTDIADVVGCHRDTVAKYRKQFTDKLQTDKELKEAKINERLKNMSINVVFGDRKIHVTHKDFDHRSDELTIHCVDMETYMNALFGEEN